MARGGLENALSLLPYTTAILHHGYLTPRLLHSAPEVAQSLLRMALQQMVPEEAWGPPKPAGPYHPADDAWNTPYALYGSGLVDDITYGVGLGGASDLELYLLLFASEYLLATKDVGFLQTTIPFRYIHTRKR